MWAKVHLKGNGNDKEWERRRETERAVGAGNGHWVFGHWTDICWGERPDSFKHKKTLALHPRLTFVGFLSNFQNATVRSLLHLQPMDPYRSLHLTLAKEANTHISHSAGFFFFTFKSYNDCPLSQTLSAQPFTGRVCLVISQHTLLFCLRHWKGVVCSHSYIKPFKDLITITKIIPTFFFFFFCLSWAEIYHEFYINSQKYSPDLHNDLAKGSCFWRLVSEHG